MPDQQRTKLNLMIQHSAVTEVSAGFAFILAKDPEKARPGSF